MSHLIIQNHIPHSKVINGTLTVSSAFIAPLKLHGSSSETVSHTSAVVAAFTDAFCLQTTTSNKVTFLLGFATELRGAYCPQMLFSSLSLQSNRTSNLET